MFTATDTEWHHVTHCVKKTITQAQNNIMIAAVEEKEVKMALFNMHPNKSPCPDGMIPGFFQKYWNIVKTDVVETMQRFFHTGELDPQLKYTNIALILKKPNPVKMTDIRPISLCSVLYKIISKVLENKLKQVIDFIISVFQSAFIPGRLITDNVMIAFEVMHYMKRKSKGKDYWMALKLDMSKAYDRVEWNYLEAMLFQMGFDREIIKLFMCCLSSVHYSISHAGMNFGSIVPGRG